MTSLELSSCSFSLLALLTEIQITIFTYLQFLDLHTLQLTNCYFYALISSPTHVKLLTIKMTDFSFLVCINCMRLCHKIVFNFKMYKRKKILSETQVHN